MNLNQLYENKNRGSLGWLKDEISNIIRLKYNLQYF